jgi:hypothetical protein
MVQLLLKCQSRSQPLQLLYTNNQLRRMVRQPLRSQFQQLPQLLRTRSPFQLQRLQLLYTDLLLWKFR